MQIPSAAKREGSTSESRQMASARVTGEAGAVGGRRGSQGPFGASAPHSHPSPATWASGAQALPSLLSEAAVPRPSLGPAVASSATKGPQPRVQTHLAQTCRYSRTYYFLRRGEKATARSTQGPGRVPPRSSLSAPFTAAAAPRPVADCGGGEYKPDMRIAEHGPKGGA